MVILIHYVRVGVTVRWGTAVLRMGGYDCYPTISFNGNNNFATTAVFAVAWALLSGILVSNYAYTGIFCDF